MKTKLILFGLYCTVFLLFPFFGKSQFTHKIKADSVRIYNDNCTAELIVENSTSNIRGFLFNKGAGRTEFRKAVIRLNDSSFQIGGDTLTIKPVFNGLQAGSVLFYDGTSINQDNNQFFWDNINKRLGVGTKTPLGVFEAVGVSYFTRTGQSLLLNPNYSGANTHAQLQVIGDMGLAFATNGDNERGRITSSGRWLFGTTTDNLTDRIQVNGTAYFFGAQPYIALYDNTWGAGSLIRSGVNTIGTAVGDYQLFNVPTGKGFSFSQNYTTSLFNISPGGAGTFINTLQASTTIGGTSLILTNTGVQNANRMELRGGTAATSVNWAIEKDNTLSNSLQITPSTLSGGTTYSNPVLSLVASDRIATLHGPGGGANSLLRYADGANAKFSTGFNNSNYIVYDDVNSAYRLTIDDTNGFVSISERGGTTPTYRGNLIINQGSSTISSNGGIEIFADGAGNGYGWRTQAVFDGSSAYNYSIQSRSNSTSWNERVAIASTGAATFTNTVKAPIFSISGQDFAYRELLWTTNGSLRWDMYVIGAEPGSNGGSNMYLSRYDDAGAYLGNIFSINRSNGILDFAVAPRFNNTPIVYNSGTWNINTTGNAATATTATNATYWGVGSSGPYTFTYTTTPSINSYMMALSPTGDWRPATASVVQTFLGLGSNAYTSTAFLPLAGGTLTGDLLVQHSSPFIKAISTVATNDAVVGSYWASGRGMEMRYNPNSAVSYLDATYPSESGQLYGDLEFRSFTGSAMRRNAIIKGYSGNFGIAIDNPTKTLHTGGSGYSLSGFSAYSTYTPDGVYGSSATPNFLASSGGGGTYGGNGIYLGYFDNGSGLYSPSYGFNVKSTDGASTPNIVVPALRIFDVDKNSVPLTIYNNGAITTSSTISASGAIYANNAGGNIRLYSDGTVTNDGFVGASGSNIYLKNWNGTRGMTITASNIEFTHSLNTPGLVNANGFTSMGVAVGSPNSVVTAYAPKGASYSDDGSTGAIKIKLPFRASNPMWTMKVRIYNYSQHQTSEYLIGNYSYDAGAYNYSATFLGGANSIPLNVRFGNDGTNDCVWIGEINTVWIYPVISVVDFTSGFRAAGAYQGADWKISIESSFNTVVVSTSPDIRLSNVTATSFSGAASGLTGVASSLTAGAVSFLGGYANNISTSIQSATIQSVIAQDVNNNIYRYNATALQTFLSLNTAAYVQANQNLNTSSNVTFTTIDGSLIRSTGDVIAYYSSDPRFKNNMVKIGNATQLLEKLSGYSFEWNNKQTAYKDGTKDLGLNAEEVYELFQEYPGVVTIREDGSKAIMYHKLIPILVESNKELNNRLKLLEEAIKRLQK